MINYVVRLTYIASIEGEPVLDTEHDSFKWLSLEEIKALAGLDHYVKEVLNNL